MSTSSNISQSTYSPSEPETPQASAQTRIQNFDQSLNHADLGLSIEQSLKNAQKEMHQKRIQGLRKELDFLKSTEWEFEYQKGFELDNDSDKEDYLAEQLLDLEITEKEKGADNETSEGNNEQAEIPRNASCFQRTGVITYIDGDNICIDGSYYFDKSACSIPLSDKDKVLYLGYKNDLGTPVVVRIIQNLGIVWDDEEENVEETNFEVMEHIMVGEVKHREERIVFINDSDLKFSLDEVEGTFVPIQGDWLEMKCSMQLDTESPIDLNTTQVVKVISFKALRSKVKSVIITDWDGSQGNCDRQIYFNNQCLPLGFSPTVGSKVIIEAIESNQGVCPWRVIKLIPVEQKPKEEALANVPDIDTLSLETEHKQRIQVTYPVEFKDVEFSKTGKINLTVTNNSQQIHFINKWMILSKRKDSQITMTPFITQPQRLFPGKTFTFTITCQPKFYGLSQEHLVIMMRGFKIDRFIKISVVGHEINGTHSNNNRKYKSEAEKIKNLRNIRNNKDNPYIPGERPVKPPNFISVRIGAFQVPDKVWSVVLGDSEQVVNTVDYDKVISNIEEKFPCLMQDLNIHNYLDRWHTLLYMEEIQEHINMRVYDMPKVFLIRCQEYLNLEINNLSERRPSLVMGDKVIVKDIWDSRAPNYEGYIHAVKGNFILMKFNKRFQETYSGYDVSVEFHFGRGRYRRGHMAINLALSNLGPDVLFPNNVSYQPPQIPPEQVNNIQWYNENLNEWQKTAVSNILLGRCRPKPYCIYGPPGTGKTVTVLETILQILTLFPDSRILVATPSNSAANLITERLLNYKDKVTNSFIRIIANYLCDSDTIPVKIRPYCATVDIAREGSSKPNQIIEDGINRNCQKSFVGRHRVTIGTCYCLGSLIQMGFPKGHFTHIIVDEAGQATEPEIMIPMTFIDKASGQIILAGDPMQLGPIISSRYCLHFDMEESYLCRLLETFPYQKDYTSYKNGYNESLVTKLNDNYRSLEDVIKLPSEMFYDGSLVPKISEDQSWIQNILNVISEVFPTENSRRDGVYVYGIRGVNTRAEESPSWYNPQEASMVALTTCKLFKKNIAADDIGIITPYIAQIKYLRTLFDAMGLPQPKIGTVEEFQGQERPIIIISTVRSSESLVQDDLKNALGFVKNPKRINVALTRAQVAVLLFCNPQLLCKDPLWCKVIEYAVKGDKYVGCDLPYGLCKSND